MDPKAPSSNGEGRQAEDRAEALREALLLVLERWFGELPRALRREIDAADVEELKDWFDQALEASSLEDVFGDEEFWAALTGQTQTVSKALRSMMERARAEGEAEAWRGSVLHLLEQRFGPLPDSARQRVGAVTSEKLEVWFARALDAASLEDVFSADEG